MIQKTKLCPQVISFRVNLSIATTDSWRDKNSGEMQERTEHRRLLRPACGKYVGNICERGSRIYIEEV